MNKDIKIGTIVVHKYKLLQKLKILSKVNDSQYEVEVILTGEKLLCMRIYLLEIEEMRDEIINDILN